MNFTVETIGIISGLLSSLTFLPQIRKTLKTKSVQDISANSYLIILLSELGWMLYGILTGSLAIIVTTVIACLSVLFILYLKNKYSASKEVNHYKNNSIAQFPISSPKLQLQNHLESLKSHI